jgi:hypothetical protein
MLLRADIIASKRLSSLRAACRIALMSVVSWTASLSKVLFRDPEMTVSLLASLNKFLKIFFLKD